MRWMLDSKCRHMRPEQFFVENLTPGREAIEAEILCAGCPVAIECLLDASEPQSVSRVIREVIGVDLPEPEDEVLVSGVVRGGKVLRIREEE